MTISTDTQRTYLGFVLSVFLAGFLGYLLVVGQSVLFPLVLALFITYVLYAVSMWIERIRIRGRGLPHGVALAVSVLLMLGVLWGVIEVVAANIRAVADAAPGYQEKLETLLDQLIVWAGVEQVPEISSLFDQATLVKVVNLVIGALQSIAGNAFTIFFYVLFLLLEMETVGVKLANMFPDDSRRRKVQDTLANIGTDIRTYLGIKTFVSLLTGVLSYSVMAWYGVDFAPFWALLIFLLNYIPYIGSLIGVIFPTLLTLLQFGTVEALLVVGLLLAGTQLVCGNLIEPKLTGQSLNLSPIVVMLSLVIWGNIWGIAGMFLSVPLTAVLMIILASFPSTRPIAVLCSATGELRVSTATAD